MKSFGLLGLPRDQGKVTVLDHDQQVPQPDDAYRTSELCLQSAPRFSESLCSCHLILVRGLG